MGRESDSLQIVALSNLLQVGVRVCYLDQNPASDASKDATAAAADTAAAAPSSAADSSSPASSSSSSSPSPSLSIRSYDFPEGAPPRVHLLYRPGHYDVLEKKKKA
jgi:ubiquitin thioesterase protein OTUB1